MEKIKSNKKFICEILCLVLGVVLSIVGLYFYHQQYLCYEYTALLFILGVAVSLVTGLFPLVLGIAQNKEKKVKIKNVVVTSLVVAFILLGLMLVINLVLGEEELSDFGLILPVYLTFVVITSFVILCIFKCFNKKIVKSIFLGLVLVGFVIGSYSYLVPPITDMLYGDFKATAPILSTYKNTEDDKMIKGDFYVSTKGNDSNSGSKDAPFRTIEKAIETVRKADKTGKNGITVCIEAGEYCVSSLEFTKEDSGTKECPITYCSYNGEVVINGGVTLSNNDFESVKKYPEFSKRLSETAQENVVVINLTKKPYSLTADDWGKIYAIGSYHTAESYDGDFVGPLYCELFVDDIRQTVARYPDNEYLYTEEVVKTGLGKESDGALTEVKNWNEIRNPESDVYKVNSELAERIGGWKNHDDIWMFGFWKYDWADASSPIGSFNAKTGEISPKFVSLYGTKTDAPYYFFNVFEELTSEGEWYLDREKGLLFLWKPDNFENAQIDLSLSLKPVINAEVDYITFDGITFKGTRDDGIVINGDNNKVQNCLIKNVAGNALLMTGSNNLAYNNEITRTGKGGIILDGGDAETLRDGNNIADNNYIHHWSEIYQTYQPAVTLLGVGNICSHNEMHDSPHEAVTYKGINHVVELNNIHDVCLLSDDAGAIYSGRSWVWYGNIVRYNCIYNVGSGEHKPDGIYLDDALSGQHIYGNLLINIPRNSIHIGGGRDNIVKNNIIINSGENAIYFDERARDGALNSGWFTHAHIGTGDMWDALYNSPWQSEIWQEEIPQYKNLTDDIENAEKPEYIPNPASIVRGNLILNKNKEIGDIYSSAYRFSDITDNEIYSLKKINEIFVDAENGDYRMSDVEAIEKIIPDFQEIPLEKIGRVAE